MWDMKDCQYKYNYLFPVRRITCLSSSRLVQVSYSLDFDSSFPDTVSNCEFVFKPCTNFFTVNGRPVPVTDSCGSGRVRSGSGYEAYLDIFMATEKKVFKHGRYSVHIIKFDNK
jgi:hypothetical protein